jgi:hypothetical protein
MPAAAFLLGTFLTLWFAPGKHFLDTSEKMSPTRPAR